MSETINGNCFSIVSFSNREVSFSSRAVYSLLGVAFGVIVGGVHLYLGDMNYEHGCYQVGITIHEYQHVKVRNLLIDIYVD